MSCIWINNYRAWVSRRDMSNSKSINSFNCRSRCLTTLIPVFWFFRYLYFKNFGCNTSNLGWNTITLFLSIKSWLSRYWCRFSRGIKIVSIIESSTIFKKLKKWIRKISCNGSKFYSAGGTWGKSWITSKSIVKYRIVFWSEVNYSTRGTRCSVFNS